LKQKEDGKEDKDTREEAGKEEEEEEGEFVPDVTVIPSLSLERPFISACGFPDFTNYVQVGREGGREGRRKSE
jgi:hypothetical protein